MIIKMKTSLTAVFSGAALGMIPVVQVSWAQQLVDPAAAMANRPTITQSLNGTPVQNIVAPNATGLSHNQFSTFNVGTQGLVINNSSVNAVSQIGGAVVANPNLGGGEARLILNEVTGANRSILQGQQELLGGRAAYILANPNGISCDGCGFINFPRATLTTGVPQLSNGALTGFGVNGGDVRVDAGGLNAMGADFFDIITRSAFINGQVNANNLSLRLGSNDVDYETLAATARANGDVPLFALDSSTLGGMYVGRISLVGTEAGVGVRLLGNVAASVSDVELDVNGRITFNGNLVSAQRDLTVRSGQAASSAGNEIELLNARVLANRNALVQGGDIQATDGQTSAQGNLTLAGQTVSSNGGTREAGQDLRISTTGAVNVAGGTVQASGSLTLNAASLALSNSAKLMGEADGTGTLGSTNVNVSGAITLADAALFSGNTANITAGSLNVDAASNDSGTQGIRATGAAAISANAVSNSGLIASNAALSITAPVTNAAGGVIRGGSLTIDGRSLVNQGNLVSAGSLDLNRGGVGENLQNSGSIEGDTLRLNYDTAVNDGTLLATTELSAAGRSLTNLGRMEGGEVSLGFTNIANTSTTGNSATIYSKGSVLIYGNNTLTNTSVTSQVAGIVARDGALSINSTNGNAATQSVINAGGLLFGGTGVTVLVSRQFLNEAGSGMRALTFANTGQVQLGGSSLAAVIAATQDVEVTNRDSDIEARTGDVNIFASRFSNTTGAAAPQAGYRFVTQISSGTYDTDGNPATPGIPIYANCGTFDDNFGEEQLGTVCARFVNVFEQYITNPDPTPRSKLIAGVNANLWIEQQALNYLSLISAAGNVNVQGTGTFENRALELRTDRSGYVVRYDAGDRTAAGNCYTGTVYNRCFYNYLELDNYPSDLIGDILKQFTDISPGAVSSYAVGMKSTVQAGGAINMGVNEVINASGDLGRVQSTASNSLGAIPLGGSTNLSPVATGALPNVGALTSSPFFIPSSNPTSPFLFETDPRLMSLAGLFGSDLFLESLGLDLAQYLRVGDPYFEQQLLRQQLLAQAGQLFIADGLSGENDQFKFLMENGVAASGNLQLRVGVALTPGQIANLQKDIVWMVEVEVNGKKALVPQLYLSDSTKAKLEGGARFVAADINLKTQGAITNSGAFVASNNIGINAGTTFTNREGTLVASNDLSIAAVGDIINQSGTIRGNDVSLTSTQGSIVNETLSRDLVFGNAGTSTVLGNTATIEATGNLSMNAQRDIVSRGAQVTAGEDATLKAGNDITFTAIEKKSFGTTQSTTQADGYTTNQRSTQQATRQAGSGLTVGGDLSATAARDINVAASAVDVAGSGSLDAGRNINIAALAETSKTDSATDTRSWNTTNVEKTTIEQTTGAASTVNFGGGLSVAAGGDLNLKGSDLAVGGDLNINRVGGDVNVTTFEEKLKVTSNTTSSSSFGGEVKAEAGKNITESKVSATATLYTNATENTNIESTTNRGSGISVGGDLNAAKGAIAGDVNITGSQIATGGDMNLNAGGNINVLAAQDTTTVTSSTTGNTFSLGAEASIDGAAASFGIQNTETNGSATQSTASVSGLRSGGSININADKDFTEQGTQVAAGKNIAVQADRINSLAAQDTFTETGDSLSASTSLGVKAETGLAGLVGSFIDDKTNKPGFDMAAASQSLSELDVPDAGSVSAELSVSVTKTKTSGGGNTARASSFASGGNTAFTAREGDATFQGTSVQAGGAIDVAAAKGSVNLLTADSGAQAFQSTTEATVTIGVSADLTISGSGSGSTATEDLTSSGQKAASFKAGTDLNISAQKDVTLVGTQLEAAGNATVEARDGKIDFQAARATATETTTEVSANASVSVEAGGTGGSVGGGGGTLNTRDVSSTGTAGSIKATNLTLRSRGDITLEGTKLAAAESATLQTDGRLDFKALENTRTVTASGQSAQVDIEASKTGGGATVGVTRTDEFEQSSTKTGGTLTAKNLTINAGTGARLEGTQVNVSENAAIHTGTGKLVLESAVSSSTKRVNNTDIEVGAKGDAKEASGQGSFKMEGAYEDTRRTTNQNVQLSIGGSADIKAAGGIDIKGSNIQDASSVIKASSTNLNGAAVNIEQRQDVNQSTRTDVNVSVGIVVPSRKARQEVADTVQKVRDSEAANTLSNKAGNAATAVKNAADTAKTRLANATSDADTRAKSDVDLAQRVQDRKDTNTAAKLTNNTALADRQAAQKISSIAADQRKVDQKADFDRQMANDVAATTRDRALARIDASAPQADQDASKAKILQTFDSATRDSAQKATDQKLAAANTAADQRAEVIKLQGNEKLQAENRAGDSTIRHRDDSAAVQIAMAAPASTPLASDGQSAAEIKKTEDLGQLQASKVARETAVKADTQKALADSEAQKVRTRADLGAEQTASTRVEAARRQQAADDAKVNADSAKTADDKAAAIEANAKKAQADIDTANRQLASEKAANAEKAFDAELLARQAQDEAKIVGEQKKQAMLADTKMQAELLKPSAAEKKALAAAEMKLTANAIEADKARVSALKAADDTLAARQKAIEQRRNDAEISASQTLADANKSADAVFKKAQEDAKATFETAKASFDGNKSLSNEEKTLRLANAQRAYEQRVSAADAVRTAAGDEAMKVNRMARDAAQKQAEDSKISVERAADVARTSANDAHAASMEMVKAARDKDPDVAKAREDHKKELETGKQKDIQQAASDAAFRKDLAKLEATQREAQAQADRKAERERVRIEGDDKLSATDKADQLKAAAERRADERATAVDKKAAEVAKQQEARDTAAKAEAIKAIDPQLSAVEKAAKTTEINKQFDQRKAEREKTRDDAIALAARQKADAKLIATADFDQRKAKATAGDTRKSAETAAEATRVADDRAARDAYTQKEKDIDQKLAKDIAGKTAAEAQPIKDKAEKDKTEAARQRDIAVTASQAKTDTALAKVRLDADVSNVNADAERSKKEAQRQHVLALAALDATNPRPADYDAKLKKLDTDLAAATTKAEAQAAARVADLQASEAETKAQIARTHRDADIEADPSLNAAQKALKLAASRVEFEVAQTKSNIQHFFAKNKMAALLTPAERAAEEAAAKRAESAGDRVKNPYAMNARLKPYITKAKRWQEVVTAFGLHVDTSAPPPEEEEANAATLVDLLGLARQFQTSDQSVALRLLRDPAVQGAAAISAAVDSVRQEARSEFLQSLRLEFTGNALGELTVAQQKEALDKQGIILSDGLSAQEVTRRFNAYLDGTAARQPVTDAQKAGILKAVGIAPRKDETVEQAYQRALTDGSTKARASAKGFGLSPAQTEALVSQITP